jgi:gluconolactonase
MCRVRVVPIARHARRASKCVAMWILGMLASLASGADGLAVDSDGRVYAATAIGVQVFSAKGQHLGAIPLSRPPQNLAFAGPDKKTLYIVGRNAA